MLPSLWEEQIEHHDDEADRLVRFGAETSAGGAAFFRAVPDERGRRREAIS